MEAQEPQGEDLIADLSSFSNDDFLKDSQLELLLPDIKPVQAEPDYNAMDTFALLSTLNLNDCATDMSISNPDSSPKNAQDEPLLPDLQN